MGWKCRRSSCRNRALTYHPTIPSAVNFESWSTSALPETARATIGLAVPPAPNRDVIEAEIISRSWSRPAQVQMLGRLYERDDPCCPGTADPDGKAGTGMKPPAIAPNNHAGPARNRC